MSATSSEAAAVEGRSCVVLVLTLPINMEIGPITPPVGLNLYLINGIAPDISLKTILWGSMPFVFCMVLAILLLCLFPGLATWLPDLVMGPVR